MHSHITQGAVQIQSQANTFQDLLAAARHLASAGYTSPAKLALWGRSAGGLAVAATLNLAAKQAAAAAAQPAAAAAEEPLGVGSLLEFERNKAYQLGRAIKQTAQGWQVEVPRCAGGAALGGQPRRGCMQVAASRPAQPLAPAPHNLILLLLPPPPL